MNNDFFFIMNDPHLRRQVDPEFRRKEDRKRENFRVSQWFDKYIDMSVSYLGDDIKKDYYTYQQKRGCDREDNRFVETQAELLIKALNILNERKERNKFFHLKDEILRTLNIEHQELRTKFYNMRYKEE